MSESRNQPITNFLTVPTRPDKTVNNTNAFSKNSESAQASGEGCKSVGQDAGNRMPLGEIPSTDVNSQATSILTKDTSNPLTRNLGEMGTCENKPELTDVTNQTLNEKRTPSSNLYNYVARTQGLDCTTSLSAKDISPMGQLSNLAQTRGLDSTILLAENAESLNCLLSDENMGKFEEIDIESLVQRFPKELRKLGITQAQFSRKVLGRGKNRVNSLVNDPKPWKTLKKGRKSYIKMWQWLQLPEHLRVSAVIHGGERICFTCKKRFGKKYESGYRVTVENCSQFGIPASNVDSDTYICTACHPSCPSPGHSREPGVGDTSDQDGKAPITNDNSCCEEDKCEPVSVEMKDEEAVCNEKNSEPDYKQKEDGDTVCNVETDKPVKRDLNSESDENAHNDQKSGKKKLKESEGNVDCKKYCSAVLCPSDKAHNAAYSILPGRFRSLAPKLKKNMISEFGIVDESGKVCRNCYNKMYRWCTAIKPTKKIKIPFHRHLRKAPETSRSLDKKCKRKTNLYACGWCKFTSLFFSTVVKHHYRKHEWREVDVVRLRSHSTKSKSPSGVGFSCESCDYTGRLRHQLHLHNDRFHKNTQNRDGITDYESDNAYSPVYPYYYYNMTLPSNYFQMQEKFKLKDVRISCRDMFKSGIEFLLRSINDQGVSKLCVDSLGEKDFVSMATLYREDVSYFNTRVENFVPVNLDKLSQKEITSIVRR